MIELVLSQVYTYVKTYKIKDLNICCLLNPNYASIRLLNIFSKTKGMIDSNSNFIGLKIHSVKL